MWGNRLGWGISAVIVFVTLTLLYLFIQIIGAVTPPTDLVTSGKALARLELPVAPSDMLTTMTQDSDAGELYRQAIEHYQADPQVYERFLSQPKAGISLRGVDLVLQAAPCSRMRLFADRPRDVVMYQSDKPAIIALTAIGRAVIVTGLLNKSDPENARRHYQAAFSLGAKLFDERLVYSEMDLAMQLLSQAARAMASLEKDGGNTAEQERWIRFDESRLDYYRQQIEPVLRAVSSIDPGVVAHRAGDIPRIALDAQDLMWRVEATLTLGRQRFFVARVGDQLAANRMLNILVNDSEPAVQVAAEKALSMTIEQYRQLH